MPAFELQDELQALQDAENYEIEHDHDFSTEDPEMLLEAAVEVVADSSSSIQDQETFDVYRSILKHADLVPGPIMSKLLDSVTSGLQAELEATLLDIKSGNQQDYMLHKVPLEMYAFLLSWFVTAAELVKQPEEVEAPPPAKGRRGRGGKAAAKNSGRSAAKKVDSVWTWQSHIVPTLSLISKVLTHLQTQRIWTATAEKDTFLKALTRPAHHVTESEQYMKDQNIKKEMQKIFCLAVKQHGQALAVQITIIQSLQFYEHLAEPMADCLAILSAEYDYPQLADEILREIGAKTFTGQDRGPRTFARFLIRYAESCPRSVLKQMSLLCEQLDSDAYPIRQAIVEIIGMSIIDLACDTNPDADMKANQKKVNGLFDVLYERVLDISPYVRSKVFNVFYKICAVEKPRFPKQRLKFTSFAVGALDDKSASVRKAAASLLSQLVNTHPWFMTHDGMLNHELYDKDYKEVSAELAKIEGAIGNAVSNEDNENAKTPEAEQEAEEGDEGEGDSPRKKKKRSRRSDDDDDSMDVDSEDQDDDEGGDTDEVDSQMLAEDDDENGTPRKSKKGSKLEPRKSQLDVTAVVKEQQVVAAFDEQELNRLRLRKKYISEALIFIDEVESAMEPMCKLLGSTSRLEVLEIMDFFRVAYERQFESAGEGIKKMLHLIWTKDNSGTTAEEAKELRGIRQRLLDVYVSLYFTPVPGLEPKGQVNRIAKNLIELTYDATLAELTSLEEMMRIMMEENHIHSDAISKLWQIYSKEKALPKPQRRGAIMILGMLALSRRSIMSDKVEIMLKVGLGPLGKADPTLARYTCIALQRLNGSAKKVKGSLVDKTQRYDMENPIFRKLQNATLHPSHTKEWFGMAEQAINAVYALGDHPDVWCDEVIKKLTARAFAPHKELSAETTEKAPEATQDENAGDVTMEVGDITMQDATQALQEDGEKDLGDSFELAQLLFVVGHVAIKQIVFLEIVEREWKRQKEEKQAAEKQATAGKGGNKEGEELDQVAGNAEDEIGDSIAAVREHELLYGPESLLAMFGPMIVHICGSPHKFKSRVLRAAATLAFSKFLCVSSQFCDQHHRLLFKIFETTKDASIRSNIVIALGDVAVSFNSIIDENSNELYKGLSDKDFVVKKNTLMVLTHLILNGMIKVKGQLGEMAKCIEDPEPRISDLAKLFFKELSTKENAIYNNLPDVISHLSSGEHAVDEEMFKNTLRHIFTYIEKEKQAENVVEKLCQRFRLSEDPRQWRDISFCLSLLPFKSERSVRKLIEGLQFYRDKLHEPTVFDRFSEILTKARQNKSKDKPDTELNEFEKILEEHRSQGQEDQALEKRVEGKKAAAKRKAAKRATRAKKPAAAPPEDDDMYVSE